MSVFRKIKSLLPASSRSLHAMHEDIVKLLHANEINLHELTHVRAELDDLNARIDAYEAQTLPMLWDIYKMGDESIEDAKRRFFRSLPKADGALRAHQLKLAELLDEFDEICRANDIRYFLTAGTLLGAIRHGGFVPWDDDVDVGVMRDDIDKLIELTNDDPHHVITTVYDQYVFCRQIRFKRAGSDDRKDPFIDLFVYEYSMDCTSDALAQAKQLRAEMMAEFETLAQREPAAYPLNEYIRNDVSSVCIQDIYDKYRKRLSKLGIYGDERDAKSIVWGIENVSYGNPTHFIAIGDYLSLQEASFEGLSYPILRNSESLLGKHYGDWLSIPRDMSTHRHYDSL